MATELRLRIGVCNGKSAVTESYFTSPLKIGTPRAKDRLNVVLMMASAGVLKGDSFHYNITCDADTKALLTEQSYTKIFDTGDGKAEKIQTITVEEHASLYYRPSAVIPFAGSTYDGNMEVCLKESSEFIYADIVTVGRVGMGERFQFSKYRSRVCVFVEGIPVWLDHCLLEPQNMDLEGMSFLDGYTHQGTFYYYGSPEKQEKLLTFFSETEKDTTWLSTGEQVLRCGCSPARKGVCVRMLAYTAQDIEEIFDKLENM